MENSFNKAIEKASGISEAKAFIIDEVNLYERLGKSVFMKLSREFYTRVYNDEQEWFRRIFDGRDMEEAIQNQYEFFIQRMGGPPLFSERRGHPALMGRHMNFNMTEKAAQRWLYHMEAALDATEEIDPDSRDRIWNFLKHTAYFLSYGISKRHEFQWA